MLSSAGPVVNNHPVRKAADVDSVPERPTGLGGPPSRTTKTGGAESKKI
jgi:hypothetical protein